ncbi:alpha,alpha-phosphotrehalase [Lachnoclostridium sp. An196]|nr:alpha,alpha-phosphotrehalase [Lachnoclostridium sp. An196]OUP20263.1 alpha,alpha-phosphotrehalase [Lachnoclostridium sp. An196]
MNLGNKVVYQIYPKSFQDTNSDGIGDLKGIIKHLDYLEELGVDYIWITPFYVSPQNDNGYDIADYRNIDPMYGTMEDFDLLVKEAAKRNIYLMMDMVFNHCSTRHEWFQKALKGDPYYRDFFIFKKGKNGLPPTNWESNFGGDAWSYLPETDEYYLHLFHVTQADLNWDNPNVRQACYDIVNFWIDKGVKGFRFDVINLISKTGIYEDDLTGNGKKYYTDGPRIHEYLQELNRNTFGRYDDIITVGEMSSTTLENSIRYSNPASHELSMIFSFHHLRIDYPSGNKWQIQPFRFHDLKKNLFTWQREMEKGGGWNALFWYNHDQPRIVSRIGDDGKYRLESAKMLATTIHGLKGTPYIYQGEEIGMTNAGFTDISQYRDIESLNYYNLMKRKGKPEEEIYESLRRKSRDNSRTPMQWDDSENAGFSDVQPWISVIPNYKEINTLDRESDNSIFNYYRKLIRLRKTVPVIADGIFEALLEEDDRILAYKRTDSTQELYVFCNYFPEETQVSLNIPTDCRCILSNYNEDIRPENLTLRPYEAVMFLRDI